MSHKSKITKYLHGFKNEMSFEINLKKYIYFSTKNKVTTNEFYVEFDFANS